ncbi:MBL fold metallo-hydrolase [Azospirillum canadense]|uniref:MBL fold metallo-hydrolase n=1 Tax=Azospirillum canadense TaxID=403962 RepID=UPI002226F07D|nr:MBL fold metallo-hydrolase [Azospirillum canadense]MCW2241608.1 L-ascorbate metabolism protein UlaG (beta-lactamase superfamily) [Azospirillum canadense]
MARTPDRRLQDHVAIDVGYRDDTRFGGMVSDRIETELRRRAAAVLPQDLMADQAAAWSALMRADAFGGLYETPTHLRKDWLYPDTAAIAPDRLDVTNMAAGRGCTVAIGAGLVQELAGWIGDWQRTARRPRHPAAAALFDAIDDAGAFAPPPNAETDDPEEAPRNRVTFLGHATALVDTGRTRVLVDPFFLAHSPGGAYRPLPFPRWAVDGILITHSHPDHFHPGTLLRFGPDVPILVPAVDRESALSVDMAHRLRELGFRRVETVTWWQERRIGDALITALPFYGEQPTADAVLHPELRNVGNVWSVAANGRRIAFCADSGRDCAGDTRNVATEDRRRAGPLDALFCGYRSWSLYPVQYVATSVARYALFVPPDLRLVRHTIMNGADEALDIAERWGARTLVPYADGGAPWYWENGLGPVLDRLADPGDHFDPPPEVVTTAAERRASHFTAVASPVRVRIARPGDAFDPGDPGVATARRPGYAWPYDAAPEPTPQPGPFDEPVLLARKKALLRVLAADAVRAAGLEVTAEQVQAVADTVRRRGRLTRRDDMLAWLAANGLTTDDFSRMMTEWAAALLLEDHFAEEVDRRLHGQMALHALAMAAEAAPEA